MLGNPVVPKIAIKISKLKNVDNKILKFNKSIKKVGKIMVEKRRGKIRK